MTEVLGIIDRGVGGLGLYKKIRAHSQRPLLYFADNNNQPYGLIEKNTLKARLDSIIEHLQKEGATKILLACNSASVVYADTNDVKGVIPFGVAALVKANANNAGLIATLGTVNSRAYTKQFKQLHLTVKEQVAQPFAVYVEAGIVDGDAIEHDAAELLKPLAACDAILMACTHFPAITPLIKRYVNAQCRLIDPMDEMLHWVNEHWPDQKENYKKESKYFVTGSIQKFIQASKISFGVSINPKKIRQLDKFN